MSGGILSGGILSGGYCPGGYCPAGYCPDTDRLRSFLLAQSHFSGFSLAEGQWFTVSVKPCLCKHVTLTFIALLSKTYVQ